MGLFDMFGGGGIEEESPEETRKRMGETYQQYETMKLDEKFLYDQNIKYADEGVVRNQQELGRQRARQGASGSNTGPNAYMTKIEADMKMEDEKLRAGHKSVYEENLRSIDDGTHAQMLTEYFDSEKTRMKQQYSELAGAKRYDHSIDRNTGDTMSNVVSWSGGGSDYGDGFKPTKGKEAFSKGYAIADWGSGNVGELQRVTDKEVKNARKEVNRIDRMDQSEFYSSMFGEGKGSLTSPEERSGPSEEDQAKDRAKQAAGGGRIQGAKKPKQGESVNTEGAQKLGAQGWW